MSLNCGIVGLPNVGKSTIFSAVTSAPAEAANYPFCTIDPNVGIVNVPDKRLDKIVELIPPERVVPATVEFVDIAGLVKGASQGEGLGNRFLGAIKEVGVIAHVVRCFDNADIIHVNNRIDPAGDIETINIELALSDYETVDKRYQKQSKLGRISKEQQKENEKVLPLYEKLLASLEEGIPARSLGFDEDERALLYDLHLITMKPVGSWREDEQKFLLRWYSLDSEGWELDKMYTFHNYLGGWYLQLDGAWASRLTVEQEHGCYSFYVWDESYQMATPLFTLYVVTSVDRDELASQNGRFPLYRSEGVAYAAQLDIAAPEYDITEKSLQDSFHLIRQDWQTGET